MYFGLACFWLQNELQVVTSKISQSVDQIQELDFTGQFITLKASSKYNKKRSSYWLTGRNYRDVWNTELKVRIFDIGKEKGGLKIVQRGGGFQTNSLRLEAKDGKQYVLRSVEKYPERAAIPEILLETLAADIIKDQISSC